MPAPSTGPPDDAELFLRLAAVAARAFFERTGEARFRHLARTFAGERLGGRPAIDDGEALERVARLIGQRGMRPWTACMIVGHAADAARAASIARRLHRKLRNPDRTGFVGDERA